MSKFLVSIGNLATLWLVWPVAALVPLGPVAVTHAQTVRMSRVDATVTPQLDGTFLYEFTVHNTTPNPCFGEFTTCDVIVNWELPIFSMTDVVPESIMSPPGWDFEIIQPGASTIYYNNVEGPYGQYRWDWDPASDPTLLADSAAYGPNPGVFTSPPFLIHWFTCDITVSTCGGEGPGPVDPIFEGFSRTGFSFLSAYGAMSAPYQASWYQRPSTTGDPPTPGAPGFGTPNSPERQAAQQVVEATFKVKRAEARKDRHSVSFDIRGRFATDPVRSDGINMPEDITITLGIFSQTIPAAAFILEDKDDDDATFEFEGDLSGITRVSIGNHGHVRIRGRHADLGNVNLRKPVPFSLQIGNDLAEMDIRFNRRHGHDDHDRDHHGHE